MKRLTLALALLAPLATPARADVSKDAPAALIKLAPASTPQRFADSKPTPSLAKHPLLPLTTPANSKNK